MFQETETIIVMHILPTIINVDVQINYCKTCAYLLKDILIDIYCENNSIYIYIY